MKTLSAIDRRRLDTALAFTNACRQNASEHKAVREARAIGALFPGMLADLADGDLIAGRRDHFPLAGFSIMAISSGHDRELVKRYRAGEELSPADLRSYHARGTFGVGYFADFDHLARLLLTTESADEQRHIRELIEFWSTHDTRSRYGQLVPEEVVRDLGPAQAAVGLLKIFVRLACASLDYDSLLRTGLPGLQHVIREKMDAAAPSARGLYQGMIEALEVVADVARHYEQQARRKADAATDAARRTDLLAMADALSAITQRAPASLLEAAQLFWLYSLVAWMDNYGRMDVYFGDFYARDVDASPDGARQADRVIRALWRLIADLAGEGKLGAEAQARIVFGGRGRRNEANADRFALAGLEASRQLRLTEPNTTLRFHIGQDARLMTKAFDLIAEGCIHPALYNDEVNIPAIQRLYRTTPADAEQYVPVGCGEFAIEGRSLNSPNAMFSYLVALDLVLHNGIDPATGRQVGLALGTPDDFATFDALAAATKKQISHLNRLLALRHAAELAAERDTASFLHMSILNADCIDRGRSIVDGGVRYSGGMVESFGLTNLADSLTAIRQLVYEQKRMTLAQVVAVLDADFEGCQRERQWMLHAPKYGNDDDTADAMLVELSRFVCTDTNTHAAEAGLDYFTLCSMNPGGFELRPNTRASADGRRKGDPMAVGNAPTAGRDTAGVTAVLNSMRKPAPMHGGYVQNLKVSRTLFSPKHRATTEAVIGAYFAQGGAQLMVTVVSRGDLEMALKEPAQHANLMVRVGGWTSRYVTLPKDIQMEILNRTLHD